jgi:hypothetical protein
MNLGDMRTLVERDLHDESNETWSTDEIDRAIQQAVQQFSYAIPVEDTSTESSLSSRDIDISSLSTRVIIQAVEYPSGNYPQTFVRFSVWGDTLSLLVDTEPDGPYDAKIYYGKMHTLDVSTSTISTAHEWLIALGAVGYALSQWGAEAINNVNVGGSAAARAYKRLGDAKLSYFRRQLKVLSSQNRVRVRQLYTPHYPISSKSIVQDF